MRLRDYFDGEEEGVRNAVLGWWLAYGDMPKVEDVGQLIRSPGIDRLYEATRDDRKGDRFAEACYEAFHAAEHVSKVVFAIFLGFSLATVDDPTPWN